MDDFILELHARRLRDSDILRRTAREFVQVEFAMASRTIGAVTVAFLLFLFYRWPSDDAEMWKIALIGLGLFAAAVLFMIHRRLRRWGRDIERMADEREEAEFARHLKFIEGRSA